MIKEDKDRVYYNEERGFTIKDRELIPIYLSVLKRKIRKQLRRTPFIPKNDLIWSVLWYTKGIEDNENYLSVRGYNYIKNNLKEYIVMKRKKYV